MTSSPTGPVLPTAPPSHEVLARFFELSSDVLAIIDGATGEIVAVNETSHAVLGYASDELVGRPWDRFVPDRDVARGHEAVNRVRDGSVPVRFTNRFRHRDERVLWIDWSLAGPYDGLVYAAGREVSAEQRRATALAAVAERFGIAFEDAPIGLAVVDTSEPERRRILHINRTLGEILGVDPATAVDALTTDFLHPDDRETGTSWLDVQLATRSATSTSSKRLVRSDGRTVVADITSGAVPDADGTIRFVILQLLGWGFVAGHRAGGTTVSAALHGSVLGALGIALILLERLVQ